MTRSTTVAHEDPPGIAARRLLTPEEVSDILGIPVRTLANWRSDRIGPLGLRIGAHVRYREGDLLEWIEQRAEQARLRMSS
ncbi:MAG: helix-turn-helix domain-containing protein [Nocardioides sp.]